MTIQDLRKKYYQKIDSFDFDILVSLVLKKPRVYILTYPEKKLSLIQVKKLESLIRRRKNNEPLAYILGEKEFYSNKFIVNKNVLVPRPETETMVDEALRRVTQNMKPTTVIDVGTGSGCIIISIAKKLKKRKNINYLGLDISNEALSVAKKNAKLNLVEKKISFIKNDLLSNIQGSLITNHNSIIITANLPYLTAEQIMKSPSIKREPRLALLAGTDGLKYYRKLFKQIRELQNKNPELEFTILCEINPSQVNLIKQLTKSILDKKYTTYIKKDLRGLSRFAIIKKEKAVG
ncbi:MAG: peptide chain release factor N(5)-glutamine methyltransferase [Patescibacteria group bacterium]|jgi:release factor glutamine methyltransferase|nr:peptide chain release factor N(5)-glutamine methyltransferase [Patescibacteria group bacterium]